jgi:hypothetical protein
MEKRQEQQDLILYFSSRRGFYRFIASFRVRFMTLRSSYHTVAKFYSALYCGQPTISPVWLPPDSTPLSPPDTNQYLIQVSSTTTN